MQQQHSPTAAALSNRAKARFDSTTAEPVPCFPYYKEFPLSFIINALYYVLHTRPPPSSMYYIPDPLPPVRITYPTPSLQYVLRTRPPPSSMYYIPDPLPPVCITYPTPSLQYVKSCAGFASVSNQLPSPSQPHRRES